MMRETRLALKGLAQGCPPWETAGNLVLVLAFFFKGRLPIGGQSIQRFFGSAVAGDNIVMEPLLRRLHQGCIGRLSPEILHNGHRVQEGLRIGLAGGKARVSTTALSAE